MLTTDHRYIESHAGTPAVPRCGRISCLPSLFTDFRVLTLVAIGLWYLTVSLLLRLVLYTVFGLPNGTPIGQLLPTIFLGTVNDLVELCYLLAPLSFSFLLIPGPVQRSLSGRIALTTIAWSSFFAIMYLAVIQYYFFKEFNARFNLVAVDYLIYPHEVVGNIFESYHVVSLSALIAVYATAMTLFFWIMLKRFSSFSWTMAASNRWFKVHIALSLICAGLFSTHSFDFSQNRMVNEIASDGISSFFEALHTNHLDYPTLYKTGEQQALTSLLQTQLAADTSRSRPDGIELQRTSTGGGTGLGKLNVVVIVEESFGCEQVDACKHGLDIDAAMAASPGPLTPKLNALAKQGLFFNQAYATGTRTVRGLEAITASFPPIPSESIIKRPGSEHMTTWGQVMREQGYHTSFLYGGFSPFDNMKTFYAGNGFAVSDRMDIDNPRFTNIWGVSDQDLFDHARTYFDQRAASGIPFFSIIMTTSNHSPYTFPEGIEGVRPKGGSRLDGIRYADHALGEFFEKSKTTAWYHDTLFVVVADHGARVYGSERIPLASYEIPLLIMAPGRLQPRQVASPISQIDIAPTVLGLLGLSYTAPFFGQNVFADTEHDRMLLFNHNHDVALYENGKLAVLGLHNGLHTYRYQLGGDHLEEVAEDRALTDLAIAYYQTAFNLFTGRGSLQNVH